MSALWLGEIGDFTGDPQIWETIAKRPLQFLRQAADGKNLLGWGVGLRQRKTELLMTNLGEPHGKRNQQGDGSVSGILGRDLLHGLQIDFVPNFGHENLDAFLNVIAQDTLESNDPIGVD